MCLAIYNLHLKYDGGLRRGNLTYTPAVTVTTRAGETMVKCGVGHVRGIRAEH